MDQLKEAERAAGLRDHPDKPNRDLFTVPRHGSFEPLITKATLSELAIWKGIHNPKLRHDIKFDPELHFRPNLNGERGKKKAQSQIWYPIDDYSSRFALARKEALALKEAIKSKKVLLGLAKESDKKHPGVLGDEDKKGSTSEGAFADLQSRSSSYRKSRDPIPKNQLIRARRTLKDHLAKIYGRHGQAVPGEMYQHRLLDRRLKARMSYAEGYLNGTAITANADTGASFNVISQAFANAIKLSPDPGTSGFIILPSGKRVFSPGQVSGTFQLENDSKSYELSCVVLEQTSHPLVLGSKFLMMTELFSKQMHRLKKVFSNSMRLSLNLTGGNQQVLPGYLNGSTCFAVPDSGSDIMVVSGAYARAHGLAIKRGPEYKHSVQFIDGSEDLTDGIAKNVAWQFQRGQEPIVCDFHVIDDLPVDAILSSSLVDEYSVFARYENKLIQMEPGEEHSGIYNIRLAERCREDIVRLEDSFLQDMTADPPFTSEIIERERARRDTIRDRISGLHEDERSQQQLMEKNRQARFDEEWRKHREREALSSQASLSSPSPPAIQGYIAPDPLQGVALRPPATRHRVQWLQWRPRLSLAQRG